MSIECENSKCKFNEDEYCACPGGISMDFGEGGGMYCANQDEDGEEV